MGKRFIDTLDELSRWMFETICRWLPGIEVWHLEEITIPVRDLLWRPALGIWFALADISPLHTQGMITAYFGDDHLELNAVFTFPRVPQTGENIDLCFTWLLADLLLRAGALAPPEALGTIAMCADEWAGGLAALFAKSSPRKAAARALVVTLTWWWILFRLRVAGGQSSTRGSDDLF